MARKNYEDDKENVVTIASRKGYTPHVPERDAESPDIPETVFFLMPDGTQRPVLTSIDISVGRRPRVEDPAVVLDLEEFNGHELGVSRQHALIKRVKNSLVLVDLDSINGTFINGHRAVPLGRYPLHDGDELMFGRVAVRLLYYKR